MNVSTIVRILQVYRAISEGVINLADCFFDMEYLDASKGLEIYKQSIADNERLSNFYAQASRLLADLIRKPHVHLHLRWHGLATHKRRTKPSLLS